MEINLFVKFHVFFFLKLKYTLEFNLFLKFPNLVFLPFIQRKKHFVMISHGRYFLFHIKDWLASFKYILLRDEKVYKLLLKIVGPVYCSRDSQTIFSKKKILKLGLTTLFTHLKIILLQYF